VDKLEQKYETRLDRLEDKLRKEQQEMAEDEADYSARKQEELIGVGESVLGFFFGKRRSTRTFSRIASKRRMTSQAKMDIEESKEEIAELQEDMAEMEAELKEMSEEITRKWADMLEEITTDEITPRRTDVNVQLVALAWLPSWLVTYDEGFGHQAATLAAYPLPERS